MPFSSALSGLRGASTRLDVAGNNIANTNVSGFKRSRATFANVVASGSFGNSSNTVGTGTKLARVEQMFTQGVINQADTNTDLAIDGNGFFIFDKDGERTFGRNGALGIDKDGNIANAQRQKLVGYLSDSNGNITGATGVLKVKSTELAPSKTGTVNFNLNLDASATPPQSEFITGFTKDNPPDSSTYNNSTSVEVFDSLGNKHVLTAFFVKAPAENTWRVYMGLDDNDVTPATTAVPGGGTPGTPTSYNVGDIAAPYTLVFDKSGNYIVNTTSSLPKHHGDPPVNSTNTDNTTLVNTANLRTISNGDLKINGVDIFGDSNIDVVSPTTGKDSSAISIVDSINKEKDKHKVTAAITSTIFDFTAAHYTTNPLTAGELTINGIQILGAAATPTAAGLVTLIGNQVPGIVASVNGAGLRLTAADGRNIRLETNGNSAANSQINFGNFAMNGGSAIDATKTGQFTLTTTNNKAIKISGNDPSVARLATGVLAGIWQDSSDVMNLQVSPSGGGAIPQTIKVNMSSSTNYSSDFSISSLTQDGYSTGKLSRIDFDPQGVITASYANGQSQQLGQVALAKFGDPKELKPVGDNNWVETYSSGVALLGIPGSSDLGLIKSSALEESNVNITDELVDLIKAQRSFEANAQAIRTASEVEERIINIK